MIWQWIIFPIPLFIIKHFVVAAACLFTQLRKGKTSSFSWFSFCILIVSTSWFNYFSGGGSRQFIPWGCRETSTTSSQPKSVPRAQLVLLRESEPQATESTHFSIWKLGPACSTLFGQSIRDWGMGSCRQSSHRCGKVQELGSQKARSQNQTQQYEPEHVRGLNWNQEPKPGSGYARSQDWNQEPKVKTSYMVRERKEARGGQSGQRLMRFLLLASMCFLTFSHQISHFDSWFQILILCHILTLARGSWFQFGLLISALIPTPGSLVIQFLDFVHLCQMTVPDHPYSSP